MRRKLTLPIVVLALARPAVPGRAQAEAPEDEIKAAMIYNIAKFADWPSSTLKNGSSPLVMCVVGGGPFASTLENTVHERTNRSHPIAVRRIEAAAESVSCHMLYVRSADAKRNAELLQAVKTSPVLTVGDAPDFLAWGGIVGFVSARGKISLEINPAAAKRAGIAISSKLLRLATVKGGE